MIPEQLPIRGNIFIYGLDALGSHDTNTVDDQTFIYCNRSRGFEKILLTQLYDPIANGIGFDDHKKITLHHAWPSEIGEISLDMGEGGGLVSYSVTFMYDYYSIENDGSPEAKAASTSKNNILI
jgi:hypothetical protein